MVLNAEPCPFCDQQIHGLIPERNVPRIRIKQILSLKEEIYSAIDSNTTWGKNQLHDLLDPVFDKHLEDA